MESALTNNKKSLLSGLFLQFPVLLVALFTARKEGSKCQVYKITRKL